MKRTLSLIITLLMVAAAVVPVFAYTPASTGAYPSEWRSELQIPLNGSRDATTFSGTTVNNTWESYTKSGNSGYSYGAISGSALTANQASYTTIKNARIVSGMNNITNGSYQVAYANTALKWNSTSKNFGSTDGATIDLGMRIVSLPTITGGTITDKNGSGEYGPFINVFTDEATYETVVDVPVPDGFTTTHVGMGGLTLDVHFSLCPGDTVVMPTATGGREMYLSFNQYYYTNMETGETTNAIVTLIEGNRNSGWGTFHEARAINLDIGEDAEFHRYTFTYDMNAEGNKLKLFCDGELLAAFSDLATRNTTQSTDFLHVGAQNRGFHVFDGNPGVTAD